MPWVHVVVRAVRLGMPVPFVCPGRVREIRRPLRVGRRFDLLRRVGPVVDTVRCRMVRAPCVRRHWVWRGHLVGSARVLFDFVWGRDEPGHFGRVVLEHLPMQWHRGQHGGVFCDFQSKVSYNLWSVQSHTRGSITRTVSVCVLSRILNLY